MFPVSTNSWKKIGRAHVELITYLNSLTKNISANFSWGLHFQEVPIITMQVQSGLLWGCLFQEWGKKTF